jgi:hypothetical protein
MPETHCETFLVGKQTLHDFSVTVWSKNDVLTKVGGFASIELAKEWIKQRRNNPEMDLPNSPGVSSGPSRGSIA